MWVGCDDPQRPATEEEPWVHVSVEPERPSDYTITAHWLCFPNIFTRVGSDDAEEGR